MSVILIYKRQEDFMTIDILDVKTEDRIILVLRKMLRDIDSLFNAKGVRYWIDGGTLLGAVRHKNVIPWDDDADICVPSRDEKKLLGLTRWLNSTGYGLSKFWGGYKIYPLNGMDIRDYNRNWKWTDKSFDNDNQINYKFPFVDIFMVSEQYSIIDFTDRRVKQVFPNFYHRKKDLLPLKRYPFDDFELWGPANPIPYLDRAYGKDWMTVGYKSYDHLNQKKLNIVKFKIN